MSNSNSSYRNSRRSARLSLVTGVLVSVVLVSVTRIGAALFTGVLVISAFVARVWIISAFAARVWIISALTTGGRIIRRTGILGRYCFGQHYNAYCRICPKINIFSCLDHASFTKRNRSSIMLYSKICRHVDSQITQSFFSQVR